MSYTPAIHELYITNAMILCTDVCFALYRQQEIAFLNQAYAQVEAVNFELEQYKQQNKELQNELAQAAEEQETLATQLYETGHHLDEAGAEVRLYIDTIRQGSQPSQFLAMGPIETRLERSV